MLVRYELCARMTRLTTQNSSLEPRGDEEEPEDQGAETAEAGGLAEAGATCPAYIGGVVTIRVSCLEIRSQLSASLTALTCVDKTALQKRRETS